MKNLAEHLFTGTWKSFKTFRRQGEIRVQNEQQYTEFDFIWNKELTIRNYKGNDVNVLVETDQWMIDFKDKKHFLQINSPKLRYEVITINHTVMVLADISSDEKIFFARTDAWKDFLNSNRHIVL
jgi:hypothetical protein